jgi:hypothetical protein
MSPPDGATFGYRPSQTDTASRRGPPIRSTNWTRLALVRLLRKVVRSGRLVVHLADAEPIVVGDGSSAEAVTLRLRDARTARRLALSPELALGETYMDGDLVVEGGEIGDLLDLLARNVTTDPRRRAGRIDQANDRLPPPAATWPTTTTCRWTSTAASSTRTCNIPAPISSGRR